MKKNYILFLMLTIFTITAYAQACNQDNSGSLTNFREINPESNKTVAIDFSVNSNTELTLNSVTVSLISQNVTPLDATGVITIYTNSASNVPDTIVLSETLTPNVVPNGTIGTFGVYDVTFNLSTPLILNNSTANTVSYWAGFVMGNVSDNTTGVGIFSTPVGLPIATQEGSNPWATVNADAIYTFTATCTTLSLDEFSKENISIYPNPVKDVINIELQSGSTIVSTELYSILGKLVYNVDNSKTINISSLSAGVYLLKVKTENGEIIKKIIKE